MRSTQWLSCRLRACGSTPAIFSGTPSCTSEVAQLENAACTCGLRASRSGGSSAGFARLRGDLTGPAPLHEFLLRTNLVASGLKGRGALVVVFLRARLELKILATLAKFASANMSFDSSSFKSAIAEEAGYLVVHLVNGRLREILVPTRPASWATAPCRAWASLARADCKSASAWARATR